MTLPKALATLAITGLLLSAAAQAQQGIPGAERPMPRFDVAPEIGEQFPDITIVDDQGDPVNIRELASQSPYTVLTLGCLT